MSIRSKVDGDVFRAFVDHTYAAATPGRVVVMHNLAVHKIPGVAGAIERAGVGQLIC